MNTQANVCLLLLLAIFSCGCNGSQADSRPRLGQTAAVHVNRDVFADYIGTYRLPSGVLLPVIVSGDRLFAGTPPAELFAQTTRRFTSNRLGAEICFERNADGFVQRLDYRLAKQSHWCDRVDPSKSTDPTQMVDAGGFSIRMLVMGNASPTIILEDGFGNGLEIQSPLQAALSSVTRVVAYDHGGTGGSGNPIETSRDARQVARELREALASANIDPPYILVGGSIGCDYCRVFAHEFKTDTVGLVLLDPTPDWDELLEWARIHAPQRQKAYRRMMTEADVAMTELMQYQEPARRAEWHSLSTTRQQARSALPLSEIPVVQITGAANRQLNAVVSDKVQFFDDWLRNHMPHAEHILALNSAHAVSITDQKLVCDHVQRLVDEVRQ